MRREGALRTPYLPPKYIRYVVTSYLELECTAFLGLPRHFNHARVILPRPYCPFQTIPDVLRITQYEKAQVSAAM